MKNKTQLYPPHHPRILLALFVALGLNPQFALAEDQPKLALKTEHFDRDPGWEGHNNRVVPKAGKMVKQDFGYSATHFAGKVTGELGGVIQRSTTPASYAAKLQPAKTLDDKLTASGSFVITASQGGAGFFCGFFNSQQPGGSGRPIGSLGMDFDFEQSGGRLAVRLITGGNKSCGTFITPYLPGKFRPTPIKTDGTKYGWTFDYDPHAASGNGQFIFTLTSETHKTQDYGSLPDAASEKEARARFPNTTTFTVDLTPGFRKEGATFDRFGVLNMMKAGGTATMFLDDLKYNDQKQDFSKDPEWIGTGNRKTFEDREQVGAHDFGFSAKTSFAGGAPGEVGGGLWRSGDFGYYADRVGPLDLNQRLEARGKVKLVTAGPDSDMSLGWFNSAAKDSKEEGDAKNFVGIHVGGPTRIGHYFIPHLATAKGTISKVDQGPILTPGKLFDWSLVYDPAANGGLGEMCVTLGNESVTLKLKPGQKTEGANLDRFGLFTSTAGGQMVKIFLDDLSYTARRSVDEPSPSPKNNSAIYRPSPSLQKPRQSAPIHLGVGPHLFLDEFLIESNTNIGRVVNSPLRAAAIPNPIVTGKGDGNFQPYLTVLRDPATRRFRIWYGAQTAESSASESQLAYMESDDGIQWIRPRRILPTPFLRFGVSIIDQGVNFPHADARYKLGWYAAPVTKGESRPADGTVLGGLKIASSPDGFVWKQLVPPDSTNDVVLMHDHDINGIFRDAVADRYVAIASTLATGETWTGKRRVTLQSFSRDLLRWEKPSYALTPDDRLDEGDTQFYAMDGFLIRGDLRIAMVKILRDDFKPEGAAGIGYTALAWSRDGEHWIRDRTPFFQRDERNEAWDHSHAWIDEQVPVGDEVYFYYAGYMHGHKVNRFEERQIGLVKMQRDRYVAREAGAEQGMITTPLVELSGKTFTLNVNARGGEVRVQIVDRKNKPIKDFTFADCAVIDRDGVSESVRWKQHSNLSPLAGKPLKLQIQMRAAKLYALQFGN